MERDNIFPHKHKKKEEIINIIEGKKRIKILIWRENFKTNYFRFKNNLIARINKDNYHSIDVLSKFVIYHEIKPGPFNLKINNDKNKYYMKVLVTGASSYIGKYIISNLLINGHSIVT